MINKTTYQIEMRTDGKHRVIVTVEDPGGSKAAIAAARGIYSQLLKDEDLAVSAEQPESLDEDNPRIRGVHQIPMVLVNGRKVTPAGAFVRLPALPGTPRSSHLTRT